MKNLLNTTYSMSQSTHRLRCISLVGISLLIALALLLVGYSGQLLPFSHAASNMHVVPAANTSSPTYPIKVFFSKNPDSFNNSAAVFPVDRTSPTIAVGTFSIQLLIAGPTLSEQQAGYFTELNTMFSGPSNCSSLPVGGPDFTLTLNMKGPKPETGTATIKFCRLTTSGGIGADARVTAEITNTLEQFSNIKKVVILTLDGHCFGDESGKDFCLR